MRISPWAGFFRLRSFRRLSLWLLLPGLIVFVRITKGAGFSDLYAVFSRPFWPGSAQREWLQSAYQLEQSSKLRLLEQDNARLRDLLELKKNAVSSTSLLPAAVISRSYNGWWHQFVLGKGSINGIQKGDVVIGPGGLVGKIESATPLTARVQLLTAPGSQIGVWVPRTKQHGMLLGTGTSRPQLVFLEKDPKVWPGDLVSTSPASSIMPPNLPVGVIQSVDNQALPAPYASVQLIAPSEAIDWVQVKIR